MDLGPVHAAEQPLQQIEEMDADVRDDPPGSLLGAFPRYVVPPAARRHVRQGDLVPPPVIAPERITERQHRRMKPKLEDGIDPHAAFALELLKRIEIPWVDDDRLLADGMRARPQRQTDVGVVEI